MRKGAAFVPLPARAFDTLAYLIAHRGRPVDKNEIIGAAWCDVAVTDDSLVQCIHEIRRALGDGERAAELARRAVSLQDPHFTRNIALFTAELAGDLTDSSAPEEAAAAGTRALALLDQVGSARIRAMLSSNGTEAAAVSESSAGPRRKMSAAARRKIAVAQRKRWAEAKAGSEPESPAKPKRRLSAAGRAAIIAATKKRWAAKRAEAKK